MTQGWYAVLDEDHNVVPADLLTMAEFFEKIANRLVATTVLQVVCVSTVFLCIDHALGDGAPKWFETMVFGGERDGDMWRYATWAEAAEGHEHAVELVRTSEEAVRE